MEFLESFWRHLHYIRWRKDFELLKCAQKNESKEWTNTKGNQEEADTSSKKE